MSGFSSIFDPRAQCARNNKLWCHHMELGELGEPPDMQRQHGGRVRLQNTAQQIRLHAVLLFWLKTDLRSNLGALNCEKFSRGKCSRTTLDPTWLRTHSSFSPPNLTHSSFSPLTWCIRHSAITWSIFRRHWVLVQQGMVVLNFFKQAVQNLVAGRFSWTRNRKMHGQ